MTTTFTEQEKAEFTTTNAIAYDAHRSTATSIAPCWLCMSEESKLDCRKKAVDWMNANIKPTIPINLDNLEVVCERMFGHVIGQQVEKWMAAELLAKEQREAGNPQAFFMPAA
jgi:hypothetical protein